MGSRWPPSYDACMVGVAEPGCLVLLGGNKLHRGIVEKCRAAGRRVVVVDWNERPEITGDLHIRVDVKDAPAVLRSLSESVPGPVWLAYTSIDVAVPTAVAIHRSNGLAVPHSGVCDTPLAKEHMTSCWRRDGLLNRASFVASDGGHARLAEAVAVREIIVKPNLSSSSRGITILPAGSTLSECGAALERARLASLDGQVIVEEFFRGREFTVEMLGDARGNVSVYGISVKYHTAHAGANKVATKLHYNSMLYPDSTYDRIAEYSRRCFRSIGLSSSFGHLEILMRDDGLLSPVEIGARSTGFVCAPLADVVSGRDYLADYADVLRGGSVAGDTLRSDQSGMYFFYDFPAGLACRHPANLPEFLAPGIKSVYWDRSAIVAGNRFGRIDNDTERWGFEILTGSRESLTIGHVEAAELRVIEAMEAP